MNLTVLILAAGLGTRMKSKRPKVLHSIAGLPLVGHVLKAVKALSPTQVVGVIGRSMDGFESEMESLFQNYPLVLQDPPRGSGHAVLAARDYLSPEPGMILVAYGDTPLVTPDMFETLLAPLKKDPTLGGVILGMPLEDPGAYGRLILDSDGYCTEIVEYKNATEDQRAITTCNGGAMVLNKAYALEILNRITPNALTNELYLTDYVALATKKGLKMAVAWGQAEDVLGVNSRQELAAADRILQQRLRTQAMDRGVTMMDPDSVYLCHDTHFESDVTLHPHITFGPKVVVKERVTLKSFCVLEESILEPGVTVGPFAHLRPGTHLGQGSKVGNFCEIKASTLGDYAKVNHLSYIGDADVGAKTNIGAGTITCNYDGVRKHKTTIGSDVFVGSNTSLVAPLTIGDGALIAAGSTVTKDIPEDALAFGRAPQVNKENMAKKFKK